MVVTVNGDIINNFSNIGSPNKGWLCCGNMELIECGSKIEISLGIDARGNYENELHVNQSLKAGADWRQKTIPYRPDSFQQNEHYIKLFAKNNASGTEILFYR